MTTEHLTVHHFFQACLTERSAEHTLALTDPSISVMGISKDTAILDRNGFQKMLEHEFAIHPEPVTFRIHNWNQQLLVPGLWNCFFIIDMAAYSKENIPTVISSLPVSITLRQHLLGILANLNAQRASQPGKFPDIHTKYVWIYVNCPYDLCALFI